MTVLGNLDHAGETGAVWIYRGAIAASSWRQRLFGTPLPNSANAIAWNCANELIHHHIGAEEAVRTFFVVVWFFGFLGGRGQGCRIYPT
jgi:hypothetical protein